MTGPPRDMYQLINDLDPASLEAIGARLEFRGTDATFTAMREAYFDLLPLASARTVLDLGCGTGVEVRALLERPEFSGRVIAVDQSPALIETARRLAAERGLADRVDFRVGDAHRLDLPDACAEVVIAHTLLSHVREPLAVLAEMARAAGPGGTLAIFDGDYASWTWFHPDAALGWALDEGMRAAAVAHPRLIREMPTLLRAAGLELVAVQPHAYAEAGGGRFFASAAELYGPMIARAGAVAAAAAERWLEDQRRAVGEGTFFAACNYYAYIARVPNEEHR
jgi:SAM-dependent methyltransferase